MTRNVTRFTGLLLGLLLAIGTTGLAQAQTVVTVKQINEISAANVTALNAAGTTLTTADISGFIFNDLEDTEVQFTAVVLSNPRNSGLSTPDETTGLPSRVHVFVRDIAAATDGPAGMDIQLVDGSWETNGTLGLAKGDVITVTGTVDPFGRTMQVSPSTIVVLGPYTGQGLPDSILDPVTITATSDVNADAGGGFNIPNWSNLSANSGQYVEIPVATVASRDISGDRPLWNITTDDNVTAVPIYTTSLRYRNDRNTTYSATEFNPRTDDFVPPPPGATVSLKGFLTYVGSGGADGAARGFIQGELIFINPMADDDLTILETPPSASKPGPPAALVGASTPFSVTAVVTADESRSLTSVSLDYFTSLDATVMSVAMTPTTDDTFEATIPGQPEGTFVIYSATATDNTSATATSPTREFRIWPAITKLSDIQEVSGLGGDASPFEGMTVPMDVSAIIQTDPPNTELIFFQDGPDPWSGMSVWGGSATTREKFAKGDLINITQAEVQEFRGLTQFGTDLVFTTTSSGNTPYDYTTLTTDDLADPAAAEAYESMSVNIVSPTVTETNADGSSGPFGEFRIESEGSTQQGLRVDDSSELVFYTGGDPATRFAVGHTLVFVRGVLSYTFGNFKIFPETFDADIGPITNELPPEITSAPAGPTGLVAADAAFTVSADVTHDPSRTLAVSLDYYTSADPTEMSVAMTNPTGDTWEGDIPGQADGTFVMFTITATDSGDDTVSADLQDYRVLTAITKVSHIQEVSGHTGDASPFAGMVLPMDLNVVVQTDPGNTGLIYFQDGVMPWSGIGLERDSGTQAYFAKGDMVNITQAKVEERFGLTRFDKGSDFAYTVPSQDNATMAPVELTTDELADPATAEQAESMFIRINDVEVTETNADDPSGPFGEFRMASVGSTLTGLRVDDASFAIEFPVEDDPSSMFAVGDKIEFVQGILGYSFNNFKVWPETLEMDFGIVNVASESLDLPTEYALRQNYPNPFNPVTTIAYELPAAGMVDIQVYDLLGRRVVSLVHSELAAGRHEVRFDATALTSGLYLYRLSTDSKVITRKMMVLK